MEPSFNELGLSEETLEVLKQKGFEEPTKIQGKAIPLLIQGDKNVIGQAQTGTGKTAAFGIPFMELLESGSGNVQAIVLTPTRELAIQVSKEINSLRGNRRFHIVPIYGGQSISEQLRKLKQGVDIVIGTPGRVIDHLNRGTLDLSGVKFLVLDEADEMLNMGFIEDVELIMKQTNDDKRILLFSATMPQPILHLAKKYMGDYDMISVHTELTTNLTEQIYFEVNEQDKLEVLCRIIDIEQFFYGLVFCRTKVDVDWVSSQLIDRGYDAEGLHGDLSQHQRERIMDKFRKQHVNILVATDVAARGIDIQELTHVINYSLPQDPESYVHRIGRTGRAGKEGTAITFVTPSEYRRMTFIKKMAGTQIQKKKVPEIEEVIEQKKALIKNDIWDIVESGEHNDYLSIAGEFLEQHDPYEVVAAILKYSFEDMLDVNSYRDIQDVSINRKGMTRLFVALGRNKGMTPRKLVDYIRDESNVDPKKIRDVKIYEEFSFINVPFEEAEIILDIFKKRKGKRSIVEKARDEKSRKRR